MVQVIPWSAKSKYLENNVSNALDKVNVKVTKNDIEPCHPLGDSKKVIVRFVN